MRLPLLFRRENSTAARRERDDRLQKAVADGLRTLATLFARAADTLEKQRLERGGFKKQETFLERTTKHRR